MSACHLRIAGLSLLLATLLPGVPLAQPAPLRVAILSDDLPGLDASLVALVRETVAVAGASPQLLSAAALADAALFSRERFDVLALVHSPVFPGRARENVSGFLRAGGHLVLLGGGAYRTPMCQVRGRWRDRAGFEALLAETPCSQTLFAFEEPALGDWQRSTNKPEHATTARLSPGPTGQCLRLDIRDVGPWQWDVYAATLPASPRPGSDLLCFRARGAAQTPELHVEVDEQDGARWTLLVPLQPRWQRYALEAGRFGILKDGSPAGRGGAGDRLDLSRARRISIGLAGGADKFPRGDHVVEIDEIGVAHNGLGATQAGFAAPNTVCFDTYEPYVLRGAVRVVPARRSPLRPAAPAATLAVSGLSAVGFTLWDQAELLPLLEVQDRHGCPRGWGASALVHYGGRYAGGCWLLSGLETPVFYRTPAFTQTLAGFLRALAAGNLPAECRARNEALKGEPLALTTPPPPGLHLSPEGHFVRADGRRFFLIGGNYLGSLDRLFFAGPWQQWLRRDFAKAHEAGLNCLRVYGARPLYSDPVRLAALKECARRYGIYLLIVVVDHTDLLTKEELQARGREVATVFADEPMLLGYDLQNEPYLHEVAKVKDGGQALGERYPLWQRFGEYAKAADLRNDRYFSVFPGVTGPLAPTPEWAPVVRDADGVFGDWLRWQVEAIRSVDKTHPIGVGYNSVYAALPCNARLDFVCHHAYEKPSDRAGVEANLRVFARLQRLSPGKPIALGEFGYTNGRRLQNRYLDLHTGAVGEFLHYLYAFAHGYDGCLKWALNDFPLELHLQQCRWLPAEDREAHIEQSRYGMFYADGSLEGHPKPLVPALRFLREYVDDGGESGQLDVREEPNLIGTGYVFRAPRALFAGASSYGDERLRWSSEAPANVLVRWDDRGLRLVATAETKLRLQPARFVPALHRPRVAGKVGAQKQSGQWLELELLEGEEVALRP